MKTALALILLIAAIALSGCTTAPAQAPAATPAPAVSAATPAIPDITGTWTGTMAGYAPVKGFTNYGNAPMSMIISEQHGRIVAGTFAFGTGANQTRTDCSGIIGRDGKTLTMTEKDGGYTFGDIISPSEIELTYVYDGTPNSAAIDTLRKV
ncbi:hypothetical protein [uncultured Methanoregula sp.]|uniref:hypothetical protein n=1 Tax=uncultured Methanoregula sp. TaxID=1005933 RepID=UPI002AAC3A50|nr:hypothetical protein [uncultured Methanoregula sp.]